MPGENGGGFLAAVHDIATGLLNVAGLGSRTQRATELGDTSGQGDGHIERPTRKRITRQATPLKTKRNSHYPKKVKKGTKLMSVYREPPTSMTHPPSNKSRASEAELRLVGDYREPADAVRIGVPQPARSSMPSKVNKTLVLPTNMSDISQSHLAGPFRPLDTLSQGHPRDVTVFFGGHASLSQSASIRAKQLPGQTPVLRSSRVFSPSNDKPSPKRKHPGAVQNCGGSHKRQRLGYQDDSFSAPPRSHVSVGSNDSTNPSVEVSIRHVKRQESMDESFGSAHGSSHAFQARPRSTKLKNEFLNVEEMIRPSNRSTIRSYSAPRQDDSIDDLSTEPIVQSTYFANSSRTTPISAADREEHLHAATRKPNLVAGPGAQEKLQNMRQQRLAIKTSEGFSTPADNRNNITHAPRRSERRSPLHNAAKSIDRTSTRDAVRETSHGGMQQRGFPQIRPDSPQKSEHQISPGELDDSIDELANDARPEHPAGYRVVANTFELDDKSARRARAKPEEHPSPARSDSIHDDEHPTSDIRASDFYSFKRTKIAGQGETGMRAASKPSSREYHIRCFDTRRGVIDGSGLTLHYDSRVECFVVERWRQGWLMYDNGPAAAVKPKYVFGGIYTEETPYVACLISRSSTTEWRLTDMKFSDFNDVTGFMDELSEHASETVPLEPMSCGDFAKQRSQWVQRFKIADRQHRSKLLGNHGPNFDKVFTTNDSKRTTQHSSQVKLASQLQTENGRGKSTNLGNLADTYDEIIYDMPAENGATDSRAKTRSSRPIRTYSAKRAARQESSALELDFEVPDDQKYSNVYGLGEPWKKPVVFPVEGPKKTQVTVDFQDLYRLDEGEFLNDTLIQFYLRYCEVTVPKQLNATVHFFNTYFYTSLTTSAKGKRGINYDSVKRWTAKLEHGDIFNYDFVVVPVNESAHWYLAIICNLTNINRTYHAEESGEPSSSIVNAHTEALPGRSREDSLEADQAGQADVKDDADDVQERYSQMSLDDATIESHSGQIHTEHAPTLGSRRSADRSDKAVFETLDGILASAEAGRNQNLQRQVEQPDGNSNKVEHNDLAARTANRRVKRKSGGTGLRRYDPDQPMIITLDSLGGTHPGTVKNLKDYLVAEAREKRSMDIPDGTIQGMTAKGIPGQANFCDCGLFLLGYAAKFLQNPREFVRKVAQREFDMEADWPELNPTDMRNNMRCLLQELHVEQSDGGNAAVDGAKTTRKQQPATKVEATEQQQDGLQVLANGLAPPAPRSDLQVEVHPQLSSEPPKRQHSREPEVSISPAPKSTSAPPPDPAQSAVLLPRTTEALNDSPEVPKSRRKKSEERKEERVDSSMNESDDDEMLDQGLPDATRQTSLSPSKHTTKKQKLFGRTLPSSPEAQSAGTIPFSPSRNQGVMVVIDSPVQRTVQTGGKATFVDLNADPRRTYGGETARSQPTNGRHTTPDAPSAAVPGKSDKHSAKSLKRTDADRSKTADVQILISPSPPRRKVHDTRSTPSRPPTRGKQ